jgi:phage protein D
MTLQAMAQDIADAAHLDLYFSADDSRKYGRREQKDQSDLDFLLGLCTEAGKALKIGDGKIVIFEEEEYEKKPSVGTIDLIGEIAASRVISWDFEDSKSDHYGRCHVSYLSGKKGKKIEGTFREPADEGPTLEAKRQVASQAEAEATAKALLRAANRTAKTGHLTVVGDAGLFGGAVLDLANAFSFSGRYIVTRAVHKPLGGYTTTLDVRRCLEGY